MNEFILNVFKKGFIFGPFSKLSAWSIAALEFYNTRSLRTLIKHIKAPSAISEESNDEDVYTRYDSIEDVESYLPEELSVKDVKGIRVFTPVAQVHKIPVVKGLFASAERWARDHGVLSKFGGFMVVIVEKA